MTDCNCLDCMHGKPSASAKGISKVSKSRIPGIECRQIFAVCEVMEQGLLNSPLAAYSNIEHAREVAARKSSDQRLFAVVDIPFFAEASK